MLADHLKKRRLALQAQLSSDDILIVGGVRAQIKTRDVHYPYRQDSNLLYLSEWPWPDSWLVITQDEAYGFCPEQPPEKAVWDGVVPGPSAMKETLELADAWPVEMLSRQLIKLLSKKKKLFYAFGQSMVIDRQILTALGQANLSSRMHQLQHIEHADRLLAPMRVQKDQVELERMRKSCQIARAAHQVVQDQTEPGKFEYQLAAIFHQQVVKAGAVGESYPSIVAGGARACVLHYQQNQHQLSEQDWLLIDAGCEYQGYASDVTWTYPVNGMRSGIRQAAYEWVYQAQQEAAKAAQIGSKYEIMQQTVVRILTEGLVDLKILSGKVDRLIAEKKYLPYYMHQCGHWLGIDVHDVGAYLDESGQSILLKAGMVCTIEPGLYFPSYHNELPEELKGFGIRIEDDYLIGPAGAQVL